MGRMKLSERVVSNDAGITITAVNVDDATREALSTGRARLPPLNCDNPDCDEACERLHGSSSGSDLFEMCARREIEPRDAAKIMKRDDGHRDRYQHQPWYVKRWRDRHLLLVPWYTLRLWIHQLDKRLERWYLSDEIEWLTAEIEAHGEPCTFWECWSIERGMCDVRRNWIYDWRDLKNGLKGIEVKECEDCDDD